MLEELFSFLKTTKYGLNCKKYFRYLTVYHHELYYVEDDAIYCRNFSAQNVSERLAETRRKMSQKEVQELLI